MTRVYNLAIKLAGSQDTVITRIDIQFNYISQSYSARVWLANGLVYDVDEDSYKNVE